MDIAILRRRKVGRLMPLIGLVLMTSNLLAARTDPAIELALETGDIIQVIVLFSEPETERQSPTRDLDRINRIRSSRQTLLRELGDIQVQRDFQMIPGFAAVINAEQLRRLEAHPRIEHIELDRPGTGHMAEGSPLAKIPPVYAEGIDGDGVKVAVVDSGIDTDHPDFSGRLQDQQCFCCGPAGAAGCCPNGLESQSGAGSAEDDHSHGTNVAGIMASGGAISERGGAPASDIIAVKVLDSNNSFNCLSDVVAAFDWVRVNHPDTKVLNASLGTFASFPGDCDDVSATMAAAVNNLVANDTMVFVSSGNQGSSTEMAVPACMSNAFAVGASWDAQRSDTTFLGCTDTDIQATDPTCFTNSNETLDLFGPGAIIRSSGLGGGTSSFGGTSQATPMTAGCVAALRGHCPKASISEIDAALKASGTTVIDPKNGLSFPFLDCDNTRLILEATHAPIFLDGFEPADS